MNYLVLKVESRPYSVFPRIPDKNNVYFRVYNYSETYFLWRTPTNNTAYI